MSLDLIKDIFSGVGTYDAWSLQLLKISNSRRDGTSYLAREIMLSPDGKLSSFLSEISSRYIDQDIGILNRYHNIRDYDGSSLDRTIYVLDKDSELISTEYTALIEAVAAPEAEIDPLEIRAQAYLIKGMIVINGEQHPVKFISMQNPVTNLKHKFFKSNGTFKEIEEKVISLRMSIDVVIYEDKIYMLTLAGENLFNMERAYKATCSAKIELIRDCEIVNEIEILSAIAGSGHNPRKFVSFNEKHFNKLKNANSRKRIAKKFGIPLDGDKFDMTQPNAADKLVKLLCDRGMVDPFDDNPVEVAGSKKWE